MALTKREENRRYREKRKAAGRGRTNKKFKRPPSKFERSRFVAVDGEGFSDGAEMSVTTGAGTAYTATDHHYGLLMDSDGRELWAPSGRLHGKACLDFLLEAAQADPDALLVCFGSSYDTCHMLAHILERWEVVELLKTSKRPGRRARLETTLTHDGVTHDYLIEYRPRKELRVWRFLPGADKYREHMKRDGTTHWKLNPESKCVLWDVWGFFQGKFIRQKETDEPGAVDNWLPDDPDYHFLRTMKGERSTFARSEIETIRKYTAAELRCLVAMMERIREAVRALGLTITRWDGAGAIAGAMFHKHETKDHMAETPPEVMAAARVAYSGGHIEANFVGFRRGSIFHYDVNSAYPDQIRRLPSLASGTWAHGTTETPPDGFTLVRVEFHFTAGLPFYPLFYRTNAGEILYPERGAGWYWFDEFAAAQEFAARFGAYEFRVREWHHFHATVNSRPFQFIEDYYDRRQFLVAETKRTKIPNGEEKTIKLGLNSCYGKMAQQVGARIDADGIHAPSYFQLEWAGFVTAGCRAKLMRAAMQKPECIISFATDALFSTEPLDLDCPPVKTLGAWEAQVHEGMTIIMPGVYWLHDEKEIKHYSRGFDKKKLSDPEIIHKAWARGEDTILVDQNRMVTLGAGMMSEALWALRGLFVTSPRKLQLNGMNSKRYPVSVRGRRPHKGLARTWPRLLTEDVGQSLETLMSAPYPISWIDYEEPEPETDAGADAFFQNDRDAGSAFFLT